MIRRTFDPAEVNAVLNDPEVFRWIKLPGIENVDATELVFELRNYCLIANGGVLIFVCQEPGVYEVHNNFLEAHRGLNAVKGTLAALRWVFTHTDAMIIQTRVPEFNKGAENMARHVGGVKDFERPAAWPTDNGSCAVSYWSLSYENWLKRTSSLMVLGREFHQKLDAEFDRLGVH